ncbi:MAG TPA: pantoate--beta-alanine ligase [Thermodesulfobacteriota bacterium]|nr:pantoate--beta-alanine ligase [Thermodesulfobacteriota bacterium]
MTERGTVKVVNGIGEMQALSNSLRSEGRTISFVPTMGALHEGHLSLMREGKKHGDVLVASVFVNPAQFGRGEDFQSYKRDTEGDLKKMASTGADIAFFPRAEEIYPPGYETYVEVTELEKPLCGRFRPGHFRGVATVVLKLFNIVKPHAALFGEKDYQQLQIIKKMVKDLNLEIRIIGMPIVREESGLAMSSRNAYLTREEREKAAYLSRALGQIKKRFDGGERDVPTLVKEGYCVLAGGSLGEVDYIEIRDGETLKEKRLASPGDVAALAVRIGSARLIDNKVL